MPVFIIAGLGEVLWDVYDEERFAGGAPANFAFHAVQCGAHGFLLSRVGDDDLGHALKSYMQRAGLDVSGVQISPAKPTGTVRIHLDAAGQPRFDCSKDTAFDEMELDASWNAVVENLDAILFGTLAQRDEPSRRAIQAMLDHASQAVRIFDPNLRGWNETTRVIVEASLERCQILKLNDSELAILQNAHKAAHLDPDDFLRGLMRTTGIELAAITLGSQGCRLLTQDEMCTHPGFRVPVVDTTGCGDAFAAGLVWRYLHKESLDMMALYANRIAAFVATQKGAMPPWTEDDLVKVR